MIIQMDSCGPQISGRPEASDSTEAVNLHFAEAVQGQWLLAQSEGILQVDWNAGLDPCSGWLLALSLHGPGTCMHVHHMCTHAS